MILFMVLNIVVFLVIGVTSVLMFTLINIYEVLEKDLTKYCLSTGPNCICSYKGLAYTFSGTRFKNISACKPISLIFKLDLLLGNICNVDQCWFVGSCAVLTTLMPSLWAIFIICVVCAVITLAASILGCISSCCNCCKYFA